ncbi:MAG: NAD-dependent epimerase/dehydratase family protein [Desulfarculales bacterium]|nr:NAD-dependent epimerase/dehydratase family protein [Desulfarculales bacterium]
MDISKKIISEDALDLAQTPQAWGRLQNKTVLISGAGGYVPAYFVHAFIRRNDLFGAQIKTIALCRDETLARARFSAYLGRSDFALHIQDVCEPINISEPVDFFIHAASPAGVRARGENPVNTFAANVLGGRNMLELSRRNETAGFLFLSSVDVYGTAPWQERRQETDYGAIDGLNMHNVYAIAKKAAETLCLTYYQQYKIPVLIARAAQILGPGIALSDGRLHIDFISQLKQKNLITLKSDGQARRSFLYISDALSGLLTVMLLGSPGQVYNVADENGESRVADLAALACSLLPQRRAKVEFALEFKNSPEVKFALPDVTVSSGKLRRLGWKPRWGLADGLSRMMRGYGLIKD